MKFGPLRSSQEDLCENCQIARNLIHCFAVLAGEKKNMSSTGLVRLSHLIAMRRDLDRLANNVANISTPGFKGQRASFKEHLKEATQSGNEPNANKYVSLVDNGVSRINLSQGQIEFTGNPLDVAIKGNGWFVVNTPNGNRYTRDGSFKLNSSGQLVTASGNPVVTSSGPLTFSATERNITISDDGTISTSQGTRGKVSVVDFPNPADLLAAGNNLFSSNTNPIPLAPRMASGAIEKSNVVGATEMVDLVKLTRTYEMIANMMKKDDDSVEMQRLSDTL